MGMWKDLYREYFYRKPIKVGQRYIWTYRMNDPWKRKNEGVVEILEVKNGWVKFVKCEYGLTDSKEISEFNGEYILIKGDKI